MKKVFNLFMALVMFACVTAVTDLSTYANMHSGSCGDNATWDFNADTGNFIVSGTGEMDDYPAYEDVPWYSIKSQITTVTIEEGITEVGVNCFYCCDNLTNLYLPSSITRFDKDAFYVCSSLENVYFSGEADDWVSIDFASYNCSPAGPTRNIYFNQIYVKDIVISEGVTRINDYAFRGFEFLESITLPVSLTSVGQCAFEYCLALNDVYYNGTISDWAKINFENGLSNPMFNGVNLYIQNEIPTDLVFNEDIDTIHEYTFGGFDNYDDLASVTFLNPYCDIQSSYILQKADRVYGYNNSTAETIAIAEGLEFISLGDYKTNLWLKDNIGWYFLDINSNRVKNQWMQDSVGWCYLGADGYMVTNSWIMDSVGWCYVGADGYCLTNTWMADSVGWCYLDADGRMATNQWIMDSVGWCYVGADGYCITNSWMKDSVGWCYLDANGRMVYNQWVQDSIGWCYVGADGYMVCNQWVYYSNNWYYVDNDGYMVTGTRVINGKTYLFNSNGIWIC